MQLPVRQIMHSVSRPPSCLFSSLTSIEEDEQEDRFACVQLFFLYHETATNKMDSATASTTTATTFNTSSPQTIRPNWGLLYTTEIFTIVFMSILGIATTIFNGFTIYVIYKDPLKCFRTPLTTFITAIIISDFLTGLFVEPAIATLYAIGYFHHNIEFTYYQHFLRTTQILALVTINTSFLIFLALGISGLIALGWPTIYERRVTTTSAKVGIGLIWTYCVFFALIPEMTTITLKLYYTIDLILNTTIITICLVTTYIVTFAVFKTKVRGFVDNEPQGGGPNIPPTVEKDFLKGTFLLTVLLIVTVWPYTITLYIWYFQSSSTSAEIVDKYIALVVCENILFSKFLWDPAILLLRIPTFRKSMVMLFNGLVNYNAGGVVAYNRHADEEAVEDDVQETIVVEDNGNEASNEPRA